MFQVEKESSDIRMFTPTSQRRLELLASASLISFTWSNTEIPGKIVKSLGGVYTLVYNKFYVDEVYDAAITQSDAIHRGSRSVLWRGIDNGLIDGIVNGVGHATPV